MAPRGDAWDKAVTYWESLASDADAVVGLYALNSVHP
jgi:hypothetical protein